MISLRTRDWIASQLLLICIVCVLIVAIFFPLRNEEPVIYTAALFVALFSGTAGAIDYLDIRRWKNTTYSEFKEMSERMGELKEKSSIREIPPLPPYTLADSIDREILLAIMRIGTMKGNVLPVLLEIYNRGLAVDDEDIYRKIARLNVLGLISISDEEKSVYLTGSGVDAINIPAILFATGIPGVVWEHIFRANVALRQSNWAEVIMESAKALEASFKHLIRSSIDRDPTTEEIVRGVSRKPLEGFNLGMLINSARSIGLLREGSHEAYLANEINSLRKKAHDMEKESDIFTAFEAETCDIYARLLLRRLHRLV